MTPDAGPLDAARRRACRWALAAAASGWAGAAARAAPHDSFGPVDPPAPAPALRLLGDDGRAVDLPTRLRGRVTAVQLMFTGCSATCPIQGALFADLSSRLPAPDCRLLSLSIDPLNDDPKALRAWVARFGAAPSPSRWQAAAPSFRELDRLLDFLRGRSDDAADRHTRQIDLFDRDARLVYRTTELPAPKSVLALLDAAAQRR